MVPTPQPGKGVDDAIRTVELDADHHMGRDHRAIANTQLPTLELEKTLADMDRFIRTVPGARPRPAGAVAVRYGSEDGHDVFSGELADAFSRFGRRVLQCFTWLSSPAWGRLGSVVGHEKNRRLIWSAVNARLGSLASRKVPGAVARLPAVAFCSSVLSVGFSPLVALSALERRVMFIRFPIAF